MLRYLNVLDKGLDSIIGALYSHEKLGQTIQELFNSPIVYSVEYSDDDDITNMNLFTLKNNVTIDIVTMVELGKIYIYINNSWEKTLFLEWNGIKQVVKKI